MKNLFTLLLLLQFLNLHSQNVKYIESDDLQDTYIGEINNKKYFYNKSQVYLYSRPVKIFSKQGTGIAKEGEFKILESQRFHDVFIYKNSFYTITDEGSDKIIKVSLNVYDYNFQLIESRVIIETEYIAKHKLFLHSKVADGILGIVYIKRDKTDQGITCIYNLESKVEATSKFTHPDLSQSEYSDHIFNEKFQMNVIFEHFHKKSPHAFLISSSQSTAKVQEIQTKTTLTQCKHFQFCAVSNEEFVVGSIVYSSKKGKMMTGYTLEKMSYENSKSPVLEIIKNDKIMNPALWNDLEYRRLQKDNLSSYLPNARSQRLKSIRKISNDEFLFISECQYGGGTGEVGGTGASGGASIGFAFPNGIDPRPGLISTLNTSEDIVVSSVSLKEKKVNWMNKTDGRLENASGILYEVHAPSFLVTVTDSEVKIFFDLSDKKINEKGEGINDAQFFYSYQSKVAVLSIDLTNGEGKVKAIGNDPANLPTENIIPSSFFIDEDGKICFLVNEDPPILNPIYRKQRFVTIE